MLETKRNFLKSAAAAAAFIGSGLSAAGYPDPVFAKKKHKDPDAKFWKQVSRAFMLDPQLHYHNIGGTGAYPREMVRNFDANNRIVARNPDAGMSITDMRNAIAPGFGANPDEIVLTTNTTDGMCMSLNGLSWQPGDEIISTNMEHPGGNGPMSHVALRYGVTIKRAVLPVGPDVTPQQFIDAFAVHYTANTKAICFSHIPYLSGMLLPAKELCTWARERNLITIIDGAHVPGMINVDFHDMGVDFYAGSGHKWQCGPHGTGIWYVRNQMQSSTRELDMIHGVLVSGNAVPTRFAADGTPRNIGNFLQSHGHPNEPEWQALADACAMWDAIGRDKIDNYVRGLSMEVKQRAQAKWGRSSLMNSDYFPLVSGITTINPFKNKSDTAKMTTLVTRLMSDYNIRVVLRSFPNPAGGILTSVRISTHLFHDEKDVDYVMRAIEALVPQIDV